MFNIDENFTKLLQKYGVQFLLGYGVYLCVNKNMASYRFSYLTIEKNNQIYELTLQVDEIS